MLAHRTTTRHRCRCEEPPCSTSTVDLPAPFSTYTRYRTVYTQYVPLHSICVGPVRTVPYLSNQGDSEAVPYLIFSAEVLRKSYCEFRGSSQPFSRSAARISACSPRHRQCPDSTLTGALNSGHACTGIRIESHNSEVPRLDHLRISENSGESECGPDLSDGEVRVQYTGTCTLVTAGTSMCALVVVHT